MRIVIKPGKQSILLTSSALALALLCPSALAQIVLGPGNTLTADEPADLNADIIFNGGTLAATATFSTARGVSLGAGGGSFSINTTRTLTLSGVVSGTGSLTKAGGGTLVLSATNSYSGGTVVSAGTLQIASDANLGASTGALTLNGGTLATTGTFATSRSFSLNNATLSVGASTILTHNGSVTGSGTLTKTGAGTLVLGGTVGLSGSVQVTQGVVEINTGTNLLALGSDALRLDGGTLRLLRSFTNPQNTVLGSNGGTIEVGAVNTVVNSGIISGTGSLTKAGGGSLVLTGANTYSGGTVLSEGTLRLEASSAAGTGGITTLGSVVSYGNGVVVANPIVLNSNTTQLEVLAGASATQAGVISELGGSRPLEKIGAGTLVLSGTNTYSGGTAVSAGTLQIASDANLGAITGSLTLGGGATLATTATITTMRGVDLGSISGGGRIVTAADTRLTLTGLVRGGPSAGLQKGGAGTLTLSGANSLSGNIFITDGRLRLEASGAAGTGLILTQSRSNAPSPIISYGNGVVIANALQVNAFASSGVTQLEVLAGESATQAGAISELGVATLPNRQAVEKIGGGTLTLSGTSSYGGGTTVSAGMLRLQAGSLAASTVQVLSGATLSGFGTIGGLQLASGALLSPGSTLSNAERIGTLRSQGAVTLAAGSTFAVDLAPTMGQADRLEVMGNVVLGGTLMLAIAPPSTESAFVESSYTLITASGGITGQFQSVTNPFLFFNTLLNLQSNQLVLQLMRNQTNFSDLGGTFNQRSVGTALNGVAFVNPLVAPFRTATDAASTRAAFDQLSGEIFATTSGVLRSDSRLLRDRLIGRLDFGQVPQAQVPQGIALWGDFVVTNTDTDSDGNAAASSRSVTGFFTGLEATIAQKLRLGFASGYTKTRVRAQSRGDANVDTGYLALYGGSSFGALSLKAGGSFAFHTLETTRTITQPGLAGRVQGSSKGETLQGFVEVAYAIALDKRTTLAPFVQGALASYKQKAASEESLATAALSINDMRETTVFSTFGVRFASQVRTPDEGRLIPRLTLAYQRADEDRTPFAGLRFIQAGVPFQVAGSPLAKEQFVYEAGLAYITKNERLGLDFNFQGRTGNNSDDRTLRAGLSYRF